jgi:hypothetical protein
VLKFCSLLLQVEVIILEYLDQLLEVFGGLLILKFDLLTFEAKVSWYIGQLAQICVFLQILCHLVAQCVVVMEQRLNLLLLAQTVLASFGKQDVFVTSTLVGILY